VNVSKPKPKINHVVKLRAPKTVFERAFEKKNVVPTLMMTALD